jgi:hypothetical protein
MATFCLRFFADQLDAEDAGDLFHQDDFDAPGDGRVDERAADASAQHVDIDDAVDEGVEFDVAAVP